MRKTRCRDTRRGFRGAFKRSLKYSRSVMVSFLQSLLSCAKSALGVCHEIASIPPYFLEELGFRVSPALQRQHEQIRRGANGLERSRVTPIMSERGDPSVYAEGLDYTASESAICKPPSAWVPITQPFSEFLQKTTHFRTARRVPKNVSSGFLKLRVDCGRNPLRNPAHQRNVFRHCSNLLPTTHWRIRRAAFSQRQAALESRLRPNRRRDLTRVINHVWRAFSPSILLGSLAVLAENRQTLEAVG
jgi:hypothetical protein